MRQRAHGTHSGVPIEAEFWFLYTFRNRKAVRLDVYRSRHQALEAAGLSGSRFGREAVVPLCMEWHAVRPRDTARATSEEGILVARRGR